MQDDHVHQPPLEDLHPDMMPLDSIAERAESTRRISKKHVTALMESIAAVGLIQPIAVNHQRKLLAGGHRLAALVSLKENRAEVFESLFPNGLVPVRIIKIESGEPGSKKALEIEMSENEKRRDYTGKEIAALVSRLREAGYGTSTAGARKKTDRQKHLTEALATVLGKSRRQAQRLLNAGETGPKPSTKESATARCLRSMVQALQAAAREGSLEETVKLLEDTLHCKSCELRDNKNSGAGRAA